MAAKLLTSSTICSICRIGDLYIATHYDFLKVWDASRNEVERSLAYGFVSHNDMWGADFTAHHSGRTYGQTEGYVIAKAEILDFPPFLLTFLRLIILNI
ncbi:MAG: hypothetical protein M1508_13645 [Nitrospirae bacterium]|nr:hypothetical protein [Nitrospirota bacterium]MCL5422196.1 hypothetical protein [Nitrospirota bacterium]